MKYIVIDEDGELRQLSAPRPSVALRDLGPEGWDQVRLRKRTDLRGFVNDCGMLLPDRYGRNVVGSILLASCGANIYPYCGPVVITGWVEPADPEIIGLTDQQIYQLKAGHADIRAVLDADRDDRKLPPLLHCTRAWQEAVIRLAGEIRTGPLPTPQVLTGAEALEHLARNARP